ncbi:hypothetical protein P389DRAFT_14987 [Cystobasidium minutum MCA 4210]|uniref:uncharacterized protein n=1 Tax=Cystobasidium minutum MCA 4210 TaxID=1397322 RepID=UPI0034CEB047|eukprot:jgi/Rhomi1/14987/CE14986_288
MASLSGKSSEVHVHERQVPSAGGQDAEEARLDQQLEQIFTIPAGPPPSYTRQATSFEPVAVPTLSGSVGSPFVRAWAPELQKYGVTQEKWLEFLDALSYAMTLSTPLQVLGNAGKVLGVVPFGPALLSVMNNSANTQTGQRILRKSSTDKYLKRVNEEYFAVRGLRACLMKEEALKTFCGKADSAATPPKTMAKIGKAAESFFTTVRLPIITPIASAVLDAVKPLPPVSSSSSTLGSPQTNAERRVQALHPNIAELNFDVPNSTLPAEIVEQASRNAVLLNRRTVQSQDVHRQALGSISRREMTAQEYAGSLQAQTGHGSSRRAFRDERKAIRRAYKQERRAHRGRNTGATERRANMAERRNLNRERDLLWLVVYPVERDSEIVGIEDLDTESPLQLSDGEYQEEMEAYEYEESEAIPPPYQAA